MTIEKAIEIVKDYQGIVYKQLETFKRFRKNKFIKVNEEAHKEIDDRYIAIEVMIKHVEDSEKIIKDMEHAIKDMQGELGYRGKEWENEPRRISER